MHRPDHPSIAIIADAHFHDLDGYYGVDGVRAGRRTMTMRPLAQTARATRLFNESAGVLRAALADVAARGIEHVVLLGDYSDDGQVTTLAGLGRLLDDFRRKHGLRFYAVPGNHDIFGPDGRHRAKRFLNAGGGHDLVTSDIRRQKAADDDARIVWPGMRCLGYPQGLEAIAGLGFFGVSGALHWETPFGRDPDPAARRYRVRSPDGSRVFELMDASYLVESVEGLWLLMIDANVFVPLDADDREGNRFADSTDAGWNGMLRHKAFILDWMADVARRAGKAGKALLAFSHYPALDPLDGTGEDERALFGETDSLRRVSGADVADALMRTGIRLHFSGHMHVNDTARSDHAHGHLVNVAVPSLVAFPAAYKIVTVGGGAAGIATVPMALALDPDLMSVYAGEAARTGVATGGMLQARDYGAFLDAHIGHLAGRRHLKREWPPELAQVMRRSSLTDIAAIATGPGGIPADVVALAEGLSAMDFLGDWYRLRMGSGLGLDAIAARRLAAYGSVSTLFGGAADRAGPPAPFQRLFRMYARYKSGLPSCDFTVDLASGGIDGC